jgi:predicted dehydrogenase
VTVVRIGVVGVGVIGRTHVDALLSEPRCRLAGVADPTPTAAAYAKERGLPYFADYAEMLENATPDGVPRGDAGIPRSTRPASLGVRAR